MTRREVIATTITLAILAVAAFAVAWDIASRGDNWMRRAFGSPRRGGKNWGRRH